jgi:uncharacterized membrane protein
MMLALPGLLLGSLLLRPYVFALLALYLVAAAAEWGWRRTTAFTALAGGVAFLAEFASTRVGVPFGLYHYTGITYGRELYLGNVPFFDPLSFTFLAYASLGLARWLFDRWPRWTGGRAPGRCALALTAGLLMMWLDVVIDPLAVRGDRWFLGRIFYYPDPGVYFGVPVANLVGWAVVGAGRLPGRSARPLWLYYLVLAFNLAVTAAVAERALFVAGVLAHLPLAAIVVSCQISSSSSDRSSYAGEPA